MIGGEGMFRNRLLYLALSIAMVCFCILYNVRVTMLVAITVICFPIVSLFLMLYLRSRIKLTLTVEPAIVRREEQCTIQIFLENNSLLPVAKLSIRLLVQNGLYQINEVRNIPLSCTGRSKQRIEMHLIPQYSGEIIAKIGQVRLWDYSRCVRVPIPVEEECNLLVLPKESQIQEPIQIGSMHMFENESAILPKAGAHPSEILNIREYEPGDRISRIHWKLSSKCDELMIKEYASPLYYYPLFLIDTRRHLGNDAKDYMECLYEVIFNFAVWHLEGGQPIEFAFYDVQLGDLRKQAITNREELYDVIQSLFRNSYSDEISQCMHLFPFEQARYQYSNLLYITLDVTKDVELLGEEDFFTICFQKDIKEIAQQYEKFGFGKFMVYQVGKGEDEILRAVDAYLHRGRGGL